MSKYIILDSFVNNPLLDIFFLKIVCKNHFLTTSRVWIIFIIIDDYTFNFDMDITSKNLIIGLLDQNTAGHL